MEANPVQDQTQSKSSPTVQKPSLAPPPQQPNQPPPPPNNKFSNKFPKSLPISKLTLLLLIVTFIVTTGALAVFIYSKLNPVEEKTVNETPTPPSKAAEADPTADWIIFKDETSGIQFKYPKSWTAKQDEGWTLSVFLEDKPFEIPKSAGFLSSIEVRFNEAKNTVTNKLFYQEDTLSEGRKRIEELFDSKTIKITSLNVGGREVVQISGSAGPGPLQDKYLKYTLVQLDNRLLVISLSNQTYEEIHDQILSTFKFTDSGDIDTTNWKTYSGNGFTAKYDPAWTANADNDFGATSIFDLSTWEESVSSSGNIVGGPTQYFTVQVKNSNQTPEEYVQEITSDFKGINLGKYNRLLRSGVIYKKIEKDSKGYNLIVSNGEKIAIINIPIMNPLDDQTILGILSTFQFTE